MKPDWTLNDAARLQISEEEFRMAWNVVEGVASGTVVPMKNPSEHGTVSIEDEGEVTEYRFTDTPFTRHMFAVRDLFGRENPKWMACHMRLDAIHDLHEDPRHWRWVRQIDGSWRIFEGMLDAAATVPLRWFGDGDDATWAFKADEFFAVVEAIYASGKYQHTGEVW